MDSQAAIDYAAQHFPNQPIHDFGRLIGFRYHNAPNVWRWAIIEQVYADYVEGYCLLSHAECNNQAQSRRKFWFDHIVSDIILIDGKYLTCRQYYEAFVTKYYPNRHFGYQMIDGLRINEGKPQVYFTGFPAAEKKALEAIANNNGFWVTAGMTEQMAYLVCGPRAGAKKIQKAQEMDTIITDKDGFMTLLDSGEIIRI